MSSDLLRATAAHPTTGSSPSRPGRPTARRIVRLVLSYFVLGLGGVAILMPFFWMLSTALKRQEDVYKFPPEWFSSPHFANFAEALTLVPFYKFALNTATVVSLVVLGTLVSCSFAAYGFARLRAPGRDAIFLLVIATIMLPTTVTLVPTYIMFNYLGWINSFKPLIIPAFFGVPFYIFLLRQFYLTIPRELEDAARIDGAGYFRIWWTIMLPLSKPALATVMVFTFIAAYNDFFGPLIYLTDESKWTIAVALSTFTGSPRIGPQMHLLMAATTIAAIPSILVFLLAQRYFVRGIVLSGITR
ncbi:carbohydrate ABC transporter permease [Tenggerimyces flavus]|uniref:Carbohydrate ABC transporter permease n=1 Tax=Tenggerimyces flavus TaxID=1708749 RepID=A0ABV7Y9I7_9ACTN|nr:carbohydrate ABC transporter permease [Tenggerimyces flavus]MBM7791177.1 multiple sugar transport system permease protein/sn-glycerol 3-phosphate transport system permease protein [Tenggerimyces flavus]